MPTFTESIEAIDRVLHDQRQTIMELVCVLQECADYLDNLSDCEIVEGRYRPNRPLQLVSEINHALEKLAGVHA